MRKFVFFLFLFTSSLLGDELTVDPPVIWDTPCAPCSPPRCCGSPSLFPDGFIADGVTVDLVNPLYSDGVLSTCEGGVLLGPNLRIQARKIVYTRKLDCDPPIYSVYCEGDLLIDYKKRVLVGDTLFYDFTNHCGTLKNGRTFLLPWYLGGECVDLLSNGDITIQNGYITTSEGGEQEVTVRTPYIHLSHDHVLTARHITFRVLDTPIFWIPKIHLDLQQSYESPFGVTFGWGGYPGTHVGLRYQFLKWGDLKGYARVDAFFGQGFGGGIETQYCPSGEWVEWYTRNYYASDLAIFDPERKNRYRFQGTYFNRIWNDSTTIHAVYDFVSDGEMAAEYTTEDFEMKAADKTQLEIRRQEDFWIARLLTRVRVNSFQSINQKLPELAWTWHPFEIAESGIIAESLFKAAYLDYVASNEISQGPVFKSGRFEVRPRIYRPFYLGPFNAMPEASFIGIAYSNNQEGKAVGQAVGDLGLKLETAFSYRTECVKHVAEPYIHYHFLTNPKSAIDDHFIFTLNDSYSKLNLVRFGLRNTLFFRQECLISRPLWVDIWANAFFDEKTIPQAIPKGYLDVEYTPYSRLFLALNSGWNFQEKEIDFYNVRADWTFNEHLAAGIEYRHRSRFAWRKADFYNFILETVRTQQSLLDSPLSDRRNTLLFRAFYRLNPDWTTKFQLRHGWNRLNQRPYTEYDVELGTVVFQHWRLAFSYEKREADHRFSFTLKLNPTPAR